MEKKILKTTEELEQILNKVLEEEDYLDNFSYEDDPVIEMTCPVWGEEIYPYTRDVGPAEYAEDEFEIELDYDRDELVDFLKTSLKDTEVFEDENLGQKVYNLDDGETLEDFVEKFTSSLTEIFRDEVEEHFEDEAQEQAQEQYDEYCADRAADAEVDRWESSLEDREQDYYERAADYYDNLY